jgi:hypothetical protein
LFIFPPLGLSGPLIVFAGIGLLVLAAVILRLPDDTPRTSARGRVVEYPSIGSGGRRVQHRDEDEDEDAGTPAKLGWRDARVVPWSIAGVVGGHGYAAMLGAIGFLVIDRIGLPAQEAQQPIAIVLMGGAVATLLGQWWLIPQLHLSPRGLVIWGSALAAVGAVLVGIAGGIYGLTLSFALASLGFGLYRPGFTSGASLAVGLREQNAVAGVVTSVNGIPYIVGPAMGVLLYGIWMPLPFILTGATMAILAIWASLRLRPSDPGASAYPG